MNPRFLNMFLDAGNHTRRVVGESIDIKLRRLFQKLINQNRAIGSESDCVANICFECFLIVNDRHRASAEHIARTHQHGVTDPLRDLTCFLDGSGHTVVRLRNTELFQQCAEAFAIFSKVDRIRRRSDHSHARVLQPHRQIQRRLATELNDDTFRLLNVDDVHHVFERKRLEVESIGSIVVSRDRFGIAVDHDGLEAGLMQRKRSVTTAVVKLDSLSNAVWTRAEDHDLASIRWRGLVFGFVS